MMKGVNLVKIHCKYFCKCHNVPPYSNNMAIKIKNKREVNPLLLQSSLFFYTSTSQVLAKSLN
jgi:hypothetical protein